MRITPSLNPVALAVSALALLTAVGCSSEQASSPPGSGGNRATGGSAGSAGGAGGSTAGNGGSNAGGSSAGGSSAAGSSSGGASGSTGASGGASGAGGFTGGGGGAGNCEGKGVDTSSYGYGDNVPASATPPGGLPVGDVPMFVTIGWDDNAYSGLDGSSGTGGLKWATDMIAARKHANGKPIHNTFYLTSTYIDTWISESPTYVKRAWNTAMQNGNEIGNHTQLHGHGSAYTLSQWDTEIQSCIDSLLKPFDPAEPNTSPSASAGIGVPADRIYGFRTPFLEYNDDTFKSVKSHGFWYDTSIEEGFQYEQDGTNYNWPFTLDNGSPGHEVLVEWGSKTPITQHPGLWEMPVYPLIVPPDDQCAAYGVPSGLRAKMQGYNSWFGLEDGKITGFDYNLWVSFKMTKAEFLATLKYSLDLRLQGNRAPFMLGAHTDYYSSKYTAPPSSTAEERQQAIEEFIDYALSKPEVRIVPVKEILDWVRDPKPASCL